ncbi:vitelline membrane outer layer protein 1 homolog isoform X2 [Mytilus trossulus]
MTESQCANVCLQNSDNCCEITYATSTRECKLAQSGCCHTVFDDESGSNILHSSRKYGDYTKVLFVSNGGVLGDWADEEICTKGHYAIGYKMKIENPYEDDNTDLNAIEIICGSRGGVQCGETASSGQQKWGDWTGDALCPENTFLTSFSLQVQKFNVESTENVGASYVKFKCRNFKDSVREFNLSYLPGYGAFGSYGEWSDACPVNSAICGIQTNIQPHIKEGDDTALNDVKFFCCE